MRLIKLNLFFFFGQTGSDTGTDADKLAGAFRDMFDGEELGFDSEEKIDRSLVMDGWNSKVRFVHDHYPRHHQDICRESA